jgi:hypothetical protein
MAKTKTTPYDTDYLKTEEDGRCILKPAFIAKALGDMPAPVRVLQEHLPGEALLTPLSSPPPCRSFIHAGLRAMEGYASLIRGRALLRKAGRRLDPVRFRVCLGLHLGWRALR